VWATRRRQTHGGRVVLATQACSGLRLLTWNIVDNDTAAVYLPVPLPGL
jgi:hypothetical protein